MPFAYVTQPGTVLKKQGRQLILQDQGETIAAFGIQQLEALILRGNVHLTTAALKTLLANGIQTSFLSRRGKMLGHLASPQGGNLALRLAQYQLLQDHSARLMLARRIVHDKLLAQEEVLGFHADNHPSHEIRIARAKIQEQRHKLNQAQRLEQLLGMEGQASAVYWSGFTRMNRSSLLFQGRSRRPPRDEINALLSLGYVILGQEIRALLEGVGFDTFLGVYHEPKANRPSLALDLLEPFRHVLIDRLVLRIVNLGRLKASDFRGDEERGYFLERRGWKLFLTEYEERLHSTPRGFLEDAYPQARTWRELLQKHCLHWRRAMLEQHSRPERSEVSSTHE